MRDLLGSDLLLYILFVTVNYQHGSTLLETDIYRKIRTSVEELMEMICFKCIVIKAGEMKRASQSHDPDI